jgi:hypothetical protein
MAAGQERRPRLLQDKAGQGGRCQKLGNGMRETAWVAALSGMCAFVPDLEFCKGVEEVDLGAVQVSREALLQAAEALP